MSPVNVECTWGLKLSITLLLSTFLLIIVDTKGRKMVFYNDLVSNFSCSIVKKWMFTCLIQNTEFSWVSVTTLKYMQKLVDTTSSLRGLQLLKANNFMLPMTAIIEFIATAIIILSSIFNHLMVVQSSETSVR